MLLQPHCIECRVELPGAHIYRRYCSSTCKSKWRRRNVFRGSVTEHECRMCGVKFSIRPDQGNKWLCSDECRRASQAKSVRTFHQRRPQQDAIYRERAKSKRLPDDNLTRFYRTNPNAPRACESCGEDRVLDVAHRPEFQRLGAWRSSKNCKWPKMVWVLCPTCHALLDRMHYSPDEIGLK